MSDYHVEVNDKVCHVKDYDLIGNVTRIDDNLEGITTCLVLWEDSHIQDIQWTNKLVKI